MAKIVTVLGTRPEIVKLSSLLPLLEEGWSHALIHTGQHYDTSMVDIIFRDLNLRAPDCVLSVGSGSHAVQTARIIDGVAEVLEEEHPELVIVQGDTNTTLGATLAATKLGVPVAHIEAGCRSFNRTMPEEQNRVAVDHLSTYLFAPDDRAARNLEREGIAAERVFMAGSTGIDACLRNWGYASALPTLDRLNLEPGNYGVVTVHRAENTTPETLREILTSLAVIADELPLIFPIHPRTHAVLGALNPPMLLPLGLKIIEPVGYLDLLALLGHARVVFTDSGGVQEETAALHIPTFILREETEWQTYIDTGLHVLVGRRTDQILRHTRTLLRPRALDSMRLRALPPMSGAGERIATTIASIVPCDRSVTFPTLNLLKGGRTA